MSQFLPVMVNKMCHLIWHQDPDVRSNIILGVSVGVFFDEINI